MSTVEARLDNHEARIKKLEGSGPVVPPVPPIPPVQGHPKPPTGAKNPKIVHVGANAYDTPHVPENVLVFNSADKEKRFTAKGIGSWLDMNFDKVYDITGVDMSFYKGTERKQRLDVIDDENVLQATLESDGQTEYQRFLFTTPIKTNKLKLVNQGNGQNDWFSIRAVSPFGKDSSTQPDPEPQCPSGHHYDQVQKKCVPDTTPSGNLDLAGLPIVYPTKAGGEEYTASDFSYKRSTHNQSNESNIPRDTFSIANVKAVNVECTFVGSIDGTKSDDFSFKVGSKTHSDSNKKEGQCYSVGIGFDGEVHISKETPEHPTTPNFDDEAQLAPGVNENTIGNIRNVPILIKVVRANVASKVRLEVWYALNPIDASGKVKSDLVLKPYFTAVDDGSWKNAPQLKNAASVQTVYMRIDHVDEKTKLFGASIREIDENPQPTNRMFARASGAMTVLAFPTDAKKIRTISRETGNSGLLRLIRDRPSSSCNDTDDDTKGAQSLAKEFTKEGVLRKKSKGRKAKNTRTSKGSKPRGQRKANRKSNKVDENTKSSTGDNSSTGKSLDFSKPTNTSEGRDIQETDVGGRKESREDKEVLTEIDQEDIGKELSLLDK